MSGPSSVTVRPFARLIGVEHMSFGKNVIIDDFTIIVATKDCPVIIGDYVHIASHCSIVGGPVRIGDFANVGAGTRLVAGSDSFHEALIGPTVPAQYRKVDRSGIVMERHAVLGANCVVLPGVTMLEGSAAGAGSVIKWNTLPWHVYRGVPAKTKHGVYVRDQARIEALELDLSLENAIIQ
jgi:acetyltransferase-like isoleucine patch superfamily enzyme